MLPSLCRPIAEYLDKQLWGVLEAALGFEVPTAARLLGQGADFVLNTPVWGREAWPFAQWVVRQPVKLHGMGVRSHKETCEPAWIGAMDKAAPYLAQVPSLSNSNSVRKLYRVVGSDSYLIDFCNV